MKYPYLGDHTVFEGDLGRLNKTNSTDTTGRVNCREACDRRTDRQELGRPTRSSLINCDLAHMKSTLRPS